MRGLTIGRVAQANGINLETVRYYERIGLMPPPARTEGGHRLYSEMDSRRLSFIRRARDLGFAIEDIRVLLALNDRGDVPCATVRAIAGEHLEEVDRKIANLQRLRQILAGVVSECSGESATHCPVLDMLKE